MNVHLSFDTEVWCNGWDRLDAAFPASFERYVYGQSAAGQYALPKTLEILNRHHLKGVFFVEPLFSARFGAEHLARIVGLLRDAGQDVQLHLHPEWTDEITPPILENSRVKRQHLIYYTQDEQAALIGRGRELLEAAGSGEISAFRSGSFAVNRDTFEALARNGIRLDSSINRCHAVSAADLSRERLLDTPFTVAGVRSFPVAVFRDGLGRDRPAQVGACSFSEMRDALRTAHEAGISDFVIVSHNFELLKPGSSEPDAIVVRRFERLCAHLAEHRAEWLVTGYRALADDWGARELAPDAGPRARPLSTLKRYAGQLARRF
ncbi:MAG: hypothetical protein ABI589_02445 [Burkholderiales bacterium]